MKPIKLSMTAFGPYKNTEVIDFNDLRQNNLFVISGKTGAGKTTIFDGICYALYGTASGSDRENQTMLRSDFAEDDTHTAVELIFELKGRTYRILRQLGHVKKGNKTKTGEKYELYEIRDGEEIPCVDRQIVSEINQKMEEIIGLTKEQFNQIVMLPQGEFRKLLTSETENKEEILRRIFKTESYKQISERLKQKKSVVEQDFRQMENVRKHHIQSISSVIPSREESPLVRILQEDYYNTNQVIEALEIEESYYENKIVTDEERYQKAYDAHAKKQNEYHERKQLNARFQELDKKETKRQELEEKVPVVEEYEKKLEAAIRAKQIEFYEKQKTDWANEEKAKSKVLDDAESEKRLAVKQLKSTEEIYQQEENKKSYREEISKKLNQLQEFLPTVKELDHLKKNLQEMKNGRDIAFKDLEKVRNDLQIKYELAEKNNETIKKLDALVSKLPDKQQKLSELRDQYRVLDRYLKLKKKENLYLQDLQEKKANFDKQQVTYTRLESLWMSNQAGMLAQHLHDGEACPVCGSLEHPRKATEQENQVSRVALDAAKKEKDEKEGLYRTALANIQANESQLKEVEEELAEHHLTTDNVEELFEKIVADGKQLGSEVDQLKKQRDQLGQLKESYEKETSVIKQLEAAKERLDKSYQEKKLNYEKSEVVYHERLNKIPENIRVLSVLEKEIHETQHEKQQLEQAWEVAQQNVQKAKEFLTKATSNVEHAIHQLKETKEKRENAEKQFVEQLELAAFSNEQEYQQAKMPQAEQDKVKERIHRFHEEYSLIKQQVKDLLMELKDKERVDLSAMETELNERKKAYEVALNALNLTKDYYQEVMKLKVNIIETSEKVEQYEKKLSIITDLYDMIRGQNQQKISFERYLQIEYLERIIEAANGRLRRLSNGQFYLIRSDRQETRGKQSGLGLDVYDAYTGQTRDVKTLSGGEKFNASLCLALGMSDVIQSFQGNISIDTMFIDEGFGSLDEESLQKSIDTLVELQQSGRMIGVISHVQELKSIFPAILEVEKTKEGFSRTKFVLK